MDSNTSGATYHIARDGKVIGIYTLSALTELRESGAVKDSDHCLLDGTSEWKLLKSLNLGSVSASTTRQTAKAFLAKLTTHSAACILGAGLAYALIAIRNPSHSAPQPENPLPRQQVAIAAPQPEAPRQQPAPEPVKPKSKRGGVLMIDESESEDYNRGYMDGMNRMNQDWIRESKTRETMQSRAEAGETQGMMDFGISLLFGMGGTVQDVPKGLYYLHRLAAAGERDACNIISSYYSRLQAPPNRRTPELRAEELKYMALGGTWPDSETIGVWRSYGNWDDQVAQEALKRAKQWADENGQTVPVSKK